MGQKKYRDQWWKKLEIAWVEGNVSEVKRIGKELFGGRDYFHQPDPIDLDKVDSNLILNPRYATREEW